MGERNRVFLLIGLMILATGIVGTTVFIFLYNAAMGEERGRLTETVKSQARLIEAVARHDMAYQPHLPGGPIKATVARIAEAHQNYSGFGKTGTFTLARRVGDRIVFLLVHCGQKMAEPLSVPWHSALAQPMRRALSGHSGTMVGLDYAGGEVLAAYEPVALLDLGIVAKIDLSEIRAPFIRAGFLAGMVMLLLSIAAAFLFIRITRPMITRIEEHARDLEKTVTERKAAADRVERLNEALRAIRNVNQLITRERHPDLLIQSACEILVSARRFRGVWIVRLDERQEVLGLSQSGMGEGFEAVAEELRRGKFPNCVKEAVYGPDMVFVRKGPDFCRNCPLGTHHEGDGVLVVPLIHDNRHYGVFVIWAPFEMLADKEDRSLFKEAADDIAFALKSIQTTEQQQTSQRALRQSEARFRLLVENAPVGIIVVDSAGAMADANEKGLEILSHISKEIVSSENLLAFPLLVDSGISGDIKKCLEQGKAGSHERPSASAGGDTVHLRYHLAPMTDSGGVVSAVQVIMEDISETRSLEGQLRQAQKMEAIGTLAGGIAHDFNNILAAILGYSQLLMAEVGEDSAFFSDLKEISKAGERARDLVRQILTFSRQTETEPIPLQPHLIVKEAIKLLRSTIPATIDIQQHVFPNTGMILADPTQIHQVVMNLCTNAYQAMLEKEGVLRIALKNIDVPAKGEILTRCPELKAGPHVQLTVEDTGSGIRPEAMEHIFDPYFTTKEKGRGTGLGLAVVHGIVGNCRGSISVESEVGKGTTFDVFFPLLERETHVDEKESETPVRSGNERILMVDDETPIVKLGKQILEKLGYRVETHTGSPEALKRFSQAPDGFDLLITDMAMPNMSGEQLAAEIRKIRPDFPVIICSGFSEIMDEERAEAMGFQGFLLKPLGRDVLARTVRAVLDT